MNFESIILSVNNNINKIFIKKNFFWKLFYVSYNLRKIFSAEIKLLWNQWMHEPIFCGTYNVINVSKLHESGT